MLVLSRKPHEEIVVPKLGITIRVLEVRGQKVRVGIEAPADVTIVRAEVLHRRESAADERMTAPNRSRMAGRASARGPRDGTYPPIGAFS
jgi:carbon storage regulator